MAATKIAIFDYNGTLVDDTKIWWDCALEVFKKAGITEKLPTAGEFIEALIGCDGIIAAYRSFGVGLTEQDINGIFSETYLGLAGDIIIEPSTLAVLATLNKNDVVCAVVTWQLKNLLWQTLKRSAAEGYFKYIHPEARDKTSAIRDICAFEKAKVNKCYYVGDLPTDIDCAHRAKVKAIALLTKLVPEHLIMAKKPDYAIRHLGELPKIILG